MIDGGWFSSAPYLQSDRSHHMLQILHAKDEVHEKKEAVEAFFKKLF